MPVDPKDRYKVQLNVTLSEYDEYFNKKENSVHRESFRRQMESIVTFYQICGVQYRADRIQIRETKTGPYPHPFYETTINEDKKITAFNHANIGRWFTAASDVTVPSLAPVLARMLAIDRNDKNGYYAIIDKFRNDYQNIFLRIEEDSLLHYWFIVDSFNNVMTELDPEPSPAPLEELEIIPEIPPETPNPPNSKKVLQKMVPPISGDRRIDPFQNTKLK
jgi:hypothetical protein